MDSSQIDTNKYYDTLMVSKTATAEEITESYTRLVQQHQPTAGGNREQFDLINKAYDILKDPEKRALYNMHGETLAPNPVEESNPWRTVDMNAARARMDNLMQNYQNY